MATPEPIHVVPFSHLDLFWTGTREECLSRGNQIIATALDILEERGEFRFLVETVNFLENYLSCFPSDTARVKRLLAEGKLGLSPLWTGIYLNMPGGETLCRNVLLAKRYTREKLDHDPRVAHFGDLPGYTPQYPQIAAKADLDGVVMSRGAPSAAPLFRWISLDGSHCLSYYCRCGYASNAMSHDWHLDYEAMADGALEKFLADYVAGQPHPTLLHWGSDLYAPDTAIARNVERWNAEGKIPLRFSTLEQYFAAAATGKDIPELAGELPSSWPNVESSWPDVWPVDMACEASLRLAEFLAAACLRQGWGDYPGALLEAAWKSLLDGMDHNQNGQGGEVADRDKLQLKLWAKGSAEQVAARMAWRLAAQVRVPFPDAFPVVVFNPLSWRRGGVVTARAAVFGDVRACDFPAFQDGARLVDETGATIPFVPLSFNEGLSFTLDLAFPVQDVPATGHKAYYLVPGKNPVAAAATCAVVLDEAEDRSVEKQWRFSKACEIARGPRRAQGADSYENAFFRLVLDRVTGEATLHDLRLGKPLVSLTAAAVEERRGDYISDMPPSGRTFMALADRFETLDNNAVWCRVRVTGSLYGMPLVQTYTLFHDFPELLLENEIDWLRPRWARMQQLFNYSGDGELIRYGVPFGHVRYPETMEGIGNTAADETDRDIGASLRLCRDWVDIGGDAQGLTVGADHRMWEFDGKTLRSYMLRGAGYCFGVTRRPDGTQENIARPPAGKYRFRYLLRPRHAAFEEAASYRAGWELNNPLYPVAVASRLGKEPASRGLLDFSASSAIVTAVKKAEDGDTIVVRAFEMAGRPCAVKLPGGAVETDILEQGGKKLDSGTLEFKPFEIKTFKLVGGQA